MTETSNGSAGTAVTLEEIQHGWRELTTRVSQLEAEKGVLDVENKALRSLLERSIEHRQKSHGELVLLITGLVSKLPLNDVGIIVSRLIEHNTNVSQYLAALVKGVVEASIPEPAVLKTFEQTKRELTSALKPVVEELLGLDMPVESELLQSLLTQPELFFSPRMLRATRCFVKGQVPRERIVREFGEEALILFTDLTTDAKLNPRPKPEEISLAFKPEFEALLEQNPALGGNKRTELIGLFQKVQRCRVADERARAQKNAFYQLSFIAELLHYYENQNTEAPDAVFAQRLPGLIEQMLLSGSDRLEEKLILQVESLFSHVIRLDHRQMIINNIGKTSPAARNLRYVLRLRFEKVPASDPDNIISDFVKHLVPSGSDKPPSAQSLAAPLQFLDQEMQILVVKYLMESDRLRKDEAEALGRAVAKELGLAGLEERIKAQEAMPVEVERRLAWANISALISHRSDAATVAAAIRDRLHAKYDADEIRQSWITLIESDPISLIRVFCQIPYLPNGKTDPIAKTVLETYVTRLTHEKYSGILTKVINSLRNMYHAKPDSPTLLNFTALVRWVDPEAANRIYREIGMPIPA